MGVQSVIDYISQEQRWLMKVGTKMVHGYATSNNFYKIHHDSNLKKTTASLPIIYFVTSNKGYIKMTNLNSCDS